MKRKRRPGKICNSIGAQFSCGKTLYFFFKKIFFIELADEENVSLTVFQMKYDPVFKTTPSSNVQYFVLQLFTWNVYTPDIGTIKRPIFYTVISKRKITNNFFLCYYCKIQNKQQFQCKYLLLCSF